MKSYQRQIEMARKKNDEEKHQVIVVDTQFQLGDNYAKEIDKIREARRNRDLVFMLTVFGDESTDGERQRVFVVAGLIATQKRWDALEPVWIKTLGGKRFHGTDLVSGGGDFQGISKEQRLKLYLDLTKLLVKTNIIGFGVAIEINAYRTLFPDVPEYMSYYMCFVPTVLQLSKIAASNKQKANFIFHHNRKTDYNSGLLYDSMINFPEVKFRKYFNRISFASDDEIGIQCVDLFAREVRRDFDKRYLQNIKYNTGKSFESLCKTGRFFYEPHDKQYLKDFRERYDKRQVNLGNWLKTHGLDNNITNRIQHMIHLRTENSE